MSLMKNISFSTENNKRSLILFFPTREQKKCSFSKTFLDTERLFGTNETERKERRVVESGARAVESGAKAGVPSGVVERRT